MMNVLPTVSLILKAMNTEQGAKVSMKSISRSISQLELHAHYLKVDEYYMPHCLVYISTFLMSPERS